MKAANRLAVVLISLAMTGCVFKESPLQADAADARQSQKLPATETQVLVDRLLEAHRETVGQMRVSSVLRTQPQIACN